jgi:hypothetical protein
MKNSKVYCPAYLELCVYEHLIHRWLSQPLIGKMPAGNLLVSAATLFCGQTYTHIAQFAEFMNLSKKYSIHLRKPSTSILQELPVSVTLMVTNVSMCWLSMSSKE